MKCIFCLEEKLPSDEHVIPESIGGSLLIKEVCRDCNSNLSRLVDNPFANCSLIQIARYSNSLGGKRDIVPFPFGGVGTVDTGHKVSVDRDFKPHVKRILDIQKDDKGGVHIRLAADASEKDRFGQLLGEPLKKRLASEFPDWSLEKLDREIAKIVAKARAQAPISEHKPIKKQWRIDLNDLIFEFLKIAYEMWFRCFGYPWVENSQTAKSLRDAIMSGNATLPIRFKLFSPDILLPVSDPFKNHLILKLNGTCIIRLFNIMCAVECEEIGSQYTLREEDFGITIQDFVDGTLMEEKLTDFLATYLSET
jgi:HNH endonuclease